MHRPTATVVTVHPSHGPPQRVARAPYVGQPISCVSDRGRWRCWGLSALALWSILTHPGGGAGQSLTPLSPCHCRHPSSGDRSAVNSICIITCPGLPSFPHPSSPSPLLLLFFFFCFFFVVVVVVVVVRLLLYLLLCCCCSSFDSS